jgi:hypothetical protein
VTENRAVADLLRITAAAAADPEVRQRASELAAKIFDITREQQQGLIFIAFALVLSSPEILEPTDGLSQEAIIDATATLAKQLAPTMSKKDGET